MLYCKPPAPGGMLLEMPFNAGKKIMLQAGLAPKAGTRVQRLEPGPQKMEQEKFWQETRQDSTRHPK